MPCHIKGEITCGVLNDFPCYLSWGGLELAVPFTPFTLNRQNRN